MKKCPFCAEEIQDEAVKCRYCGTDLRTPAVPSDVAAARPSPRQEPEKTVYEGGLHWIVFRRPAIWFALALLSSAGPAGPITFWALIGAVDLIGRLILRAHTKFVVTTRRLSVHTGVLRKRSVELLLSKVESIAVTEPYFGRLFGYGSIVVGGTGGTKEAFHMVPAPQQFRTIVQDVAHI